VNKEIDWHGPNYAYTTELLIRSNERGGEGRIYRADGRQVFPRCEGAWFVNFVCPVGWDERDALV
jgi:hypothetical protein